MADKTYPRDDPERGIRDLDILNEVVQIISTKLDTADLLQSIVSQVADKLDCTHCTIFFPEEVERELYLVPQKTHGKRSKEIMTRSFKVGDEDEEGLAGHVFRTGKSLVLANAKEHPGFAAAREQREAPRSMLVVPINVGGRKIGVISADQDVYGHFSESDRRLVEILAQHAGIAIERATGLDLLQDISRRVISASSIEETLRQIVSGAIKLTDTTAGVIYLISDDGQSITDSFEHPTEFEHPQVRMEGKGGITRQIIETGDVMVFPNIRQDPRVNPLIYEHVYAMIGVPLKSEDKVIGVLYLNDSGPHEFTEMEVSLLSTLANQAAAAIENARLFQRRVRDLEIINEVVQIMNTKLDTEALLWSIAYQIADKLKCTHCTLFFPEEVGSALYLVPQVTHGVRPEIMSRRFKVGDPEEEGLAGWVFRTGQSLTLANAREDERFAPYRQKREAPRSMLVVPIKVGDRTIGIISADQDVYGHFSESDRRLVDALGQHAGIAIERVREGNLLRTLIDHLPDLIYAKDAEGRFTLSNPTVARLLAGKTNPDELLGKTDFDFFPKELASRYRADEEEIMQSGQPLVSREEPFIDYEGNELWVLTTKVPLRDSHGNVVGLVGLNRDITERKQAKEALEERATQLERLQAVTATISEKPSDLKEILRSIVDGLGGLFSGASFAVRLYDSKTREFETETAAGDLKDLGSLLPRPSGTSRYVVKSGVPRYFDEDSLANPPDRGPAVRKDVRGRGVKAAVYLPLRRKGDIIGILYVFLTESHRFSANDKQILNLFADQAAIAIENARLFKRVRDTADENARLVERLQDQRVHELETLSQLGEDLSALEQEL